MNYFPWDLANFFASLRYIIFLFERNLIMEKRTLNGNFTKQESSLHVGFIFKEIHPSTNIAELGGNSVHI